MFLQLINYYVEQDMDHRFWVLDLQGKEVLKGVIPEGYSIQRIDIEKLPSGNYFVKIQGPNESTHHLKFTKKN